MKIISKFKDYYDTALAYGQDDSVLFLRNKVEYEKTPDDLSFMNPKNTYTATTNREFFNYKNKIYFYTDYFYFNVFNVAFCGKIYTGIRVEQHKLIEGVDKLPISGSFNNLNVIEQNDFNKKKITYCYSIEQLDELMLKLKQYDFINNKMTVTNYIKKLSLRSMLIEKFKVDNSKIDFFASKKLPIVSYNIEESVYIEKNNKFIEAGYRLIENPCLKDIQFYKLFDAATAYQELDMFISGIMAPENKPMTIIDDKHKAYQHGFDCYSFKKEPSKNNKKKCRVPA